jgi:hypothetical protein
MKVGDLVRLQIEKRDWLGIVTERDGTYFEITWHDGEREPFDLDDEYCKEIMSCWEVINESRS